MRNLADQTALDKTWLRIVNLTAKLRISSVIGFDQRADISISLNRPMSLPAQYHARL